MLTLILYLCTIGTPVAFFDFPPDKTSSILLSGRNASGQHGKMVISCKLMLICNVIVQSFLPPFNLLSFPHKMILFVSSRICFSQNNNLLIISFWFGSLITVQAQVKPSNSKCISAAQGQLQSCKYIFLCSEILVSCPPHNFCSPIILYATDTHISHHFNHVFCSLCRSAREQVQRGEHSSKYVINIELFENPNLLLLAKTCSKKIFVVLSCFRY